MLSRSNAAIGQVIEYIEDRLYFASYAQTPNESTQFPYTSKKSQSELRSPRKLSAPKPKSPVYFTLDRTFRYNAFHADFGPLHIGHLYRFAILLHEILAIPGNEDRPVVFWSKPDSRSRANAACVLACYMVLIQSWPPHLALAPLSQMDPPPMPFRDAGYSQADYALTIQDVVYGVWRAKEQELCGLMDFSLEEYETYERVDMGDFNWITPSFVAFASPQHEPIEPVPPTSPRYASIPSTVAEVERALDIPGPFRNVLSHFATRNIGLVVRLNSELYCPTYFTKLGIQHLDMIFPDGTCPSLAMVRRFIDLAHEVITVRKRCIAVHCKAGLGRTGCLIGAYLIYRYGFSASELIGFMRFQRPGMMVGPQQHWLHLNQGVFRQWWFEDTILKERLAAVTSTVHASVPSPALGHVSPTTPTRSPRRSVNSSAHSHTPTSGSSPTSRRTAALAEIRAGMTNPEPHSPSAAVPSSNPPDCGVLNENLPAPTPGQPRKNSRMYPGEVSPIRNPMRSPLRHASKPSTGDPFVDAPSSITSSSDFGDRDGLELAEVLAENADTADADLLQLRLNRAGRQTRRPASRSPLRPAKPVSSAGSGVPIGHRSHSPEDPSSRRIPPHDEKPTSWSTNGPAEMVEIDPNTVDADMAHKLTRKVSGAGMSVPKTRTVRPPGSVPGAGPNGIRKSSGRVRSIGNTAAWAAARK